MSSHKNTILEIIGKPTYNPHNSYKPSSKSTREIDKALKGAGNAIKDAVKKTNSEMGLGGAIIGGGYSKAKGASLGKAIKESGATFIIEYALRFTVNAGRNLLDYAHGKYRP